jgi:hypothetical protein
MDDPHASAFKSGHPASADSIRQPPGPRERFGPPSAMQELPAGPAGRTLPGRWRDRAENEGQPKGRCAVGDKGKRDKDKGQKQKQNKQAKETQKKREKLPTRPPSLKK